MNFETKHYITVLIVDDERDMRHILKTILQNLGFRNIYEASDVKGALHILHAALKPIDLVLCDWNLPDQTGLELLLEMTMHGSHAPFLIVSGRSDPDSVMAAKDAGVAGYIRKPFSPEQVESRIFNALYRTKTAKVL